LTYEITSAETVILSGERSLPPCIILYTSIQEKVKPL
jgi:hypothetical protein